jgi:LCP family protein required for cell wall assembly
MADEPGSRPRRTWPERLAIVTTFAGALVCFAIAAALIAGYTVVRQRNIIDLQDPSEVAAAGNVAPPPAPRPTTTAESASTAAKTGATDATGTEPAPTAAVEGTARETTTSTNAPVATFPDADPEAQNFLITGADNGACIDPDSPYAGAFGDREGMGERSDTIMVLRVDPDADRVAVLSFPRDLYVDIAGTGSKSRINSAYRRDDPQQLIDTIFENFGVSIDHYIQVDFCAFKTLVDAVGGVAVPFEFPARDENTGLNVPAPGCFVFDGEHALAYVRSRHYEYEDPPGSGDWREDPSSDLGRVSRQQDFIRRTLSSILGEGPLNPRVARGLIRAATEYVVTDRDLTAARMLEFAGVMNDVDPASILTYQIEASDRNINGAAVLVPNTDGENMQAILAMFRGETSLADAPTQVFDLTTTAAPRGATTTLAVPGSSDPTSSTVLDAPASTAPAPEEIAVESSVPDGPQENQVGIVPPRDVTC